MGYGVVQLQWKTRPAVYLCSTTITECGVRLSKYDQTVECTKTRQRGLFVFNPFFLVPPPSIQRVVVLFTAAAFPLQGIVTEVNNTRYVPLPKVISYVLCINLLNHV